MHFRFEHTIDAPLGPVEDALLHPRMLAWLPAYAPLVGSAELLGRREAGDTVERTAWFRVSSLLATFRRLMPPGAGQWADWVRWDRRTHAGSFRIEPNLGPELRRRFACGGTYRLEPVGPSTTRRVVEGRLRIDAPGVGAALERVLAAMMARQFSGEARLLGDLARAP